MVRFPSVFPSHAFSYSRNKMCFILSLLFLVIWMVTSLASPVMWWWVFYSGALVIITSSVHGVVPCRLDVVKAAVFTWTCPLWSFSLLGVFWWWVWKCTILFSLNGKRKFEQCKMTHQWESDRIQIHSHWWDRFFSNKIINGANSLLTNCDSMLHVPLTK